MLITGYRRCRCPMGLSLSRGGDPWLPIATGLGFMFWSFFRVKLYNAHPPKEIPKGLKWPIFLGRGSTVFLVEVGEKKQIQWRSQIAGFLMLINHTLVLISNHLRGTLSSRPLLLICLFAVVLDYYLYIYTHVFCSPYVLNLERSLILFETHSYMQNHASSWSMPGFPTCCLHKKPVCIDLSYWWITYIYIHIPRLYM